MEPDGAGPQLEEDWARDKEGRKATDAARMREKNFMAEIDCEKCMSI